MYIYVYMCVYMYIYIYINFFPLQCLTVKPRMIPFISLFQPFCTLQCYPEDVSLTTQIDSLALS